MFSGFFSKVAIVSNEFKVMGNSFQILSAATQKARLPKDAQYVLLFFYQIQHTQHLLSLFCLEYSSACSVLFGVLFCVLCLLLSAPVVFLFKLTRRCLLSIRCCVESCRAST